MGGSQSSISQYVSTNISTRSTNNAIISLESNSETAVRVKQNIRIEIVGGGDVNIGTVRIDQTNVTDMRIISDLTQDIGIDFVNDLRTAIENDIDATLDSTQGVLGGTFQSLRADVNAVIKTNIKQIMENEINLDSVTNFFVNLDTIQDNVFYVTAGRNINIDKIEFTQNFQLDLVSEQMVQTVLNALYENSAVQKVANEVSQALTTRQDGGAEFLEGVGRVLGSVMSGFFAPLIIISVIIAIVVVVFLVIKQSNAKKAPPPPPPPPPAPSPPAAPAA
jgi:hypothetical protein